MSALWWLLPLTLLASALLTGAMRQYAIRRQLMDVPNARSSHSLPTPRGGGVAVVLCFLGGLLVLWRTGMVSDAAAIALAGAGALVAAVGFIDDHGHIPARWRLLAHFAAAAWALLWLGGAPAIELAGITIAPGWAAAVMTAFGLVWLLNLYNFMDGIDGIAGVQAVSVCIGAAVLYRVAGSGDDGATLLQHAALALLLACAAAGFLLWNFPPAKIFMGDAGSGFTGITLGVLSLHAAHADAALLWAWVILLGVFVMDATVTLLRRLLRGEKVYQAHRSHAYQRAARRFGAHRPVTLAVGAINLCWLLPLGLLVATGRLDGMTGVAMAYLPLLALALYFRAGQPEP